MIAYKLFRQRKDGSLGSLFINSSFKVPIGEWLKAEDHPTNGYAHRPGWHCCYTMKAPHIKKNPKNGLPRVWVKVQVRDTETYNRPESQGGVWVLAKYMKVLEVMRC